PRLLLAVAWALTGAWQFIISSEMSGIGDPLRWSVLIVSVLGALGLIVTARRTVTRALASVLVIVAVVGSAAIPAQLGVRTIADSTQGSIVTIAGTSSGMGGRHRRGGGAPVGGRNAAGDGDNDGGGGPGAGGGMGGLLSASHPSAELTELPAEDASDYPCAAPKQGDNQPSRYQQGLDEPDMV